MYYYLIYLSAGSDWFGKAELDELLQISVANNRRKNITGLLLYADGNFIQLLEGDEAVVQQTFQKISLDERHKGITPLASGQLDERIFPDWAMGFKAIGQISQTPLKDMLETAKTNSGSNIAVNLLNAFVKTSRM